MGLELIWILNGLFNPRNLVGEPKGSRIPYSYVGLKPSGETIVKFVLKQSIHNS